MQQQNSSSLNEMTETMLAEIITLCGQLRESTSRTLDSKKDFNSQWLQGVVQSASHGMRSSFECDLTETTWYIKAQSQQPGSTEGANTIH